jgi:hypothetical protein
MEKELIKEYEDTLREFMSFYAAYDLCISGCKYYKNKGTLDEKNPTSEIAVGLNMTLMFMKDKLNSTMKSLNATRECLNLERLEGDHDAVALALVEDKSIEEHITNSIARL